MACSRVCLESISLLSHTFSFLAGSHCVHNHVVRAVLCTVNSALRDDSNQHATGRDPLPGLLGGESEVGSAESSDSDFTDLHFVAADRSLFASQ